MRTTIILNDKLAAEAKKLAAESNTTLSDIVNEALRERLARPRASGKPAVYRIPVFSAGSTNVDSSPSELAYVGEKEELESYGR